jgi:hypothetical protein
VDRQDKVERGLYIFGQPVPFSEAYPQIAGLKVTVEIRKDGPMGRTDTRYFGSEHPPGEYVRCPRSSCVDGGWCIGDTLREMVEKREAKRQTGGICLGRERMNRSNFRKCLTHFSADIEITYKDVPATTAEA